MSDHRNGFVWQCRIGGPNPPSLEGADFPMRMAVREAYNRIVGEPPQAIFSGWGNQWTESELAVVENRLPDPASASATAAERERDELRAKLAEAEKRIAAGLDAVESAHDSERHDYGCASWEDSCTCDLEQRQAKYRPIRDALTGDKSEVKP